MTLLESIFATAISGIVITASLNAWITDTFAVNAIETEEALEVCVNNAAEEQAVGELSVKTFAVNRQTCQVQVRRNDGIGVWVIEAHIGMYTKTLWLPQTP
jgi:type II secretory pathway pseudopilin PulG